MREMKDSGVEWLGKIPNHWMIHPFMPFTYSVDGFRKVISMSNVSLNTEIIVFVGIIIICSLLTILVYNHRIKKPTPLIPQAFENVNE